MPRKARKRSRTGVYHIILRGVNQQIIFEDDGDRKRFLYTLQKFKGVCKYEIYGYCLMDNHIHLLMKENGESISDAMKRISSSYVYWYNLKYDRCGHLFQERFRSEPVETKGYFMRVARYIHQNPMRAGLVDSVFECRWTSMAEYVGKAALVDVDRLLGAFSAERVPAMRAFVAYMQVKDTEVSLEKAGRVRVSDSEVLEHLRNLGIGSASELQRMEAVRRNVVLVRLKERDGVSAAQVSRVTGISRSVVQRA